MSEPTYRQTIMHAWQVVWENKILWILGLLAMLFGQIGFSDIFGKIWSISDETLHEKGMSLSPLLTLDISGGVWNMVGVVWLVIICLPVIALLVFLATASQGSLIAYAAQWFKNGKHQTLAKPWKLSIKHFWSILAVNIIRQLALFLLLWVFTFITGYFFASDTIGKEFLFAALAVVVLLASLVLSALSVYTLCYIVLDGKGIAKSFSKAWQLFSEHLLVSLEVGVVIMFLTFLLVGVLIAGSFFAFLPAALIWMAAGVTNLVVLAAVGLIVGIFLLLLFMAFVAGIFNAFTICAWVFLFLKMHKEGVPSRVVHFFTYMFSK
jgi:hypothetical protein